MVQNLKRRVARIEDRCGIGRDDEIVEFPLGDGRIARTTHGKLAEILAEIAQHPRRLPQFPEGVEHE
jgi:hypothetical protein